MKDQILTENETALHVMLEVQEKKLNECLARCAQIVNEKNALMIEIEKSKEIIERYERIIDRLVD